MMASYKPDHSDCVQAFTTMLQNAKKCNVKLNYDKLQYKQNEIEFFGETYQDKVAAVTSIPSTTNKKQVQSFISMINYYYYSADRC